MALHLLKLCVGIDSLQHLRDWQEKRLAQHRAAGRPAELIHRTTQTPRRRDEILDGGSLYWVIKGVVLARQPIVDLRPGTWDDGRTCCSIVMSPELIATRAQPRRAFQGWRYLTDEDAPADLLQGDGLSDIPQEMVRDLRELCLIGG
ncbi:DUF1489 family protein [Methyloligella solikamskensis]|uniref:DUF1489 family protein n=1 Tax=Methyloligella solikamskensis TaxID=1177756 RepID=A0ABW3JCH3_9HYPH